MFISITRAQYFHFLARRLAEATAASLAERQAAGLPVRKHHGVTYFEVKGSFLKFIEVPPQGPAFRGALAWACRKPGRQVTFARDGRPILFEESEF
jgi:hypothetical protein